MNTFFKYIISLSALLLVGIFQFSAHSNQDYTPESIQQFSTSSEHQNQLFVHGNFHYLQSNHSSTPHLFGVESSESGAEENENKSTKKFSAFSDFLHSLLILQKAVVSLDIHKGKEVLHSHTFKSSSFKSLFLVLEVFRL